MIPSKRGLAGPTSSDLRPQDPQLWGMPNHRRQGNDVGILILLSPSRFRVT